MKLLNSTLILLICLLLMPTQAKSQSQKDNIITIEEIYTRLIPNEISSSRNIVSPTSYKTLTTSENDFSILNSSIISDVIKDFKSNWEFIIFNEITITEVEEDNFLVTGNLSGKSFEQGIINYTEFQHTWVIQNGIVIKFLN